MNYSNNLFLVCILALMVISSAGCDTPATGTTGEEVSRGDQRAGQNLTDQLVNNEGKELARTRRIIIGDDSDAMDPYYGAKTEDDFLARRFKICLDSQVDSYFWNIGHGLMPKPSDRFDPELGKEANRDIGAGIMIRECRKAGIEIFGSLRMNDAHDHYLGLASVDPLKLQRPDLLIGGDYISKDNPRGAQQYPHLFDGEKTHPLGGYPNSMMRGHWPVFDYAKPEVRQHRLEFIQKFGPKYDFDGLELDFCRHSLYFKLGEEQENIGVMTEFIRQIRQILDEVGRQRGRPYLLTARVPDTPQWCLRSGLDVEQWLREGLLDLLMVGGGYMPYSGRYKEFIDLAHRYNVPAYPVINHFSSKDPIALRSWASNFWALGADGVYIFNFEYEWDGATLEPRQYVGTEDTPHYKCLRQMGSPETLIGLDKLYRPDRGASIYFCGYANAPNPFPVQLIHGTPIELVVGDDVVQANRQGLLEDIRLQVKVSGVHQEEGITILINGSKVAPGAIVRTGTEIFEACLLDPPVLALNETVSAAPLQRGINQIVILPGRKSIGRFSSTVTGLELSVRYKHE